MVEKSFQCAFSLPWLIISMYRIESWMVHYANHFYYNECTLESFWVVATITSLICHFFLGWLDSSRLGWLVAWLVIGPLWADFWPMRYKQPNLNVQSSQKQWPITTHNLCWNVNWRISRENVTNHTTRAIVETQILGCATWLVIIFLTQHGLLSDSMLQKSVL